MAKNQVKERIVLQHLSQLSLQELAELIQKTVPDKNFIFGDPKPQGDVRTVELPNINAVSDFDELMESFRAVHSLTKISGDNHNYNV